MPSPGETQVLEVGPLLRPLARRWLASSPLVQGFVEHRRLLSSSFVVRPAQDADPAPLLGLLSAYVDR